MAWLVFILHSGSGGCPREVISRCERLHRRRALRCSEGWRGAKSSFLQPNPVRAVHLRLWSYSSRLVVTALSAAASKRGRLTRPFIDGRNIPYSKRSFAHHVNSQATIPSLAVRSHHRRGTFLALFVLIHEKLAWPLPLHEEIQNSSRVRETSTPTVAGGGCRARTSHERYRATRT